MEDDNYLKTFFTRSILEWTSIHLREYPWRKNRSPYNVFICEFLLQRTKADQVVPIYLKFIDEFPDFESLRNAKKETIAEYFDALGLRKRVNYLIKSTIMIQASKKPIENFTDTELLLLPGVGQYTLGAFRFFTQNRRVAIVDSNIIRIFQRFFDFQSTKKTIRNDPRIWQFAADLLPKQNYDTYNYGIIDFGSLMCLPSNPKCVDCPLAKECHYFNHD